MSDRECFEEAAARLGYNLTMAEHKTGEYHYQVTQDAWWIWQEALEYARAQSGQGVEAVDDDGKGSLPWFVHVYNSGYEAGHHDTVEGGFTPIHQSDKDTYHEEVVMEILEDLNVVACHGTQPQPAQLGGVPEEEERLTDIYRRKFFECQDELNNLRSEYHNRTAELEAEMEDLQEELQRVRRQPAQQGSVPDAWHYVVEVFLENVEEVTELLLSGGAADNIVALCNDLNKAATVAEKVISTPQPEGDAVAVPVAALEYLKDQWPGAYAKLYERICSNNLPQPQKEDA